MELELTNKIAVITGGTHGIGLAIAKFLAIEKCSVVVFSRTESNVSKANKILAEYTNSFLSFVCDATKKEHVQNAISKIINTFHTIHILVNNVGGGGRWGSESVQDTEESIWLEVFNKNVLTTLRFTLLALPYMKKQKWGRIIAINSIYGRESGGRPWFNIAKVAQSALIKNMSRIKEFARNGITFNTVSPGNLYIPDTGWAKLKEDNLSYYNDIVDTYPFGRLGTADEIAGIVGFLCSNYATYITGSNILVDGGQSVVI